MDDFRVARGRFLSYLTMPVASLPVSVVLAELERRPTALL